MSKLYEVIYADPPWNLDGSRGTLEYPTMETDEIKALLVPSADKSVCFMWAVTGPKLIDALETMRAWGFEYKSQACWDKKKIGTGYWFRNQHELLLVGTKKNFSPPPISMRVGSMFHYCRSEHSRKPDIIRCLIDKWYPTASKLEMFARPYTEMWPKHDGWDTFGNEMPCEVKL